MNAIREFGIKKDGVVVHIPPFKRGAAASGDAAAAEATQAQPQQPLPPHSEPKAGSETDTDDEEDDSEGEEEEEDDSELSESDEEVEPGAQTVDDLATGLEKVALHPDGRPKLGQSSSCYFIRSWRFYLMIFSLQLPSLW